MLWTIPCMLGLVLDGKRFLETQARCLNQEEALNSPGGLISVLNFSLEFLNFVLLSQWFLGREFDWRGLHMYPWMRISHYYELLTNAIMFWDFHNHHWRNLPFFVQIWILCLKWTLHEFGRCICCMKAIQTTKMPFN